jgi:hypothetical protein
MAAAAVTSPTTSKENSSRTTRFRIDGKLMIAGSYAGADVDPA